MLSLLSQYRGLRRENYVLFFGRVVTNLGSMVWPVLTLILNLKLGMNATQVALFTIVSGAVMVPMGLIGGKLADTYNKKNCIVFCDAVSVILYLVCAFRPLSLGTVVLFVIAGAVQGMEHPAYNALIADLNPTRDREKAYSLEYLGANLGLVASPTIAGLLFAEHLSLAFLISGVAIGLSTVFIAIFIRDITPAEDDADLQTYQVSRDEAGLFEILRDNRHILLYMSIMALFWAAYHQFGYLMPLDMGRLHGEQGALIYGSINSLNCIVVVLFTPVLTRLFAGTLQTVRNLIGQVLLLAGYVVFLMGLGFIPAYYLAIFLFTLGEIMTTLITSPYLTARLPASHRGRIEGVLGTFQSMLQGLCLFLVGRLYDGPGAVSAWIFVFAIVGVSIAGGVLLIFRDKKAYPALYTADGKHMK